MTSINFQFFALHYLNDWIESDQHFVKNLSPDQDPQLRRKALCDAAQYYSIARNFGTVPGQEKLAGALSALDAIAAPTASNEVDNAVETLASALKAIYGKNLVSAASKFLWLRYQQPFVIYDRQVLQSLHARGAVTWSAGYSRFRRGWHDEFNQHRADIHSACRSLSIAKPFSLASEMPTTEFEKLVMMPWFSERVFDKYLWWRSG